ncbi:hypothetical protein [Ruegeria aquimaris]|uniref:Uncharacterized protein n=1 Tax=Ruegeria aquimaris TaxID=2984333 RepID=A0ABT3AHA0_9RHOB|nr:hypothetical protein [Ruegeria sp. XHP0148]MCV2887957.1 hypothetical protein [Ruegeria sp. XHP0148]
MTPFVRIFFPGIMLVATAFAIQLTGLAQRLGADPWWADKVIWAGIPLGIGLAMTAWVLRIPRNMRLVGFSLLTFFAFAVAKEGKLRFADSLAEDALAGQAWYLGWLATCALAAAAVSSLFRYDRQTH